jgi:undecaprenyl pyrophosphate synthase
VKLVVLGARDILPSDLVEKINLAERESANCTGLTLNIAVNTVVG